MQPTALGILGVPPATARLASYFAANPTARPTLRELQRTLGVSSASVQRDIDRLVRGGAIRIVIDGRKHRFAPTIDAPLWAALRLLLFPTEPRATTQVHESAQRYGVDLSQLKSMLRLTIDERLRLLEENASFIAAAQAGRRKGKPRA